MFEYENGNTKVKIFSNGTKIRKYSGVPNPIYPESIDLKITNYCDLHNYCQWCHEMSDKNGNHANLDFLFDKLKDLPNGVELAIGGGNPLDHPNLKEFLIKLKKINLVPNLTVNELHLKKFHNLLTELINEKLIYGLGISYSGKQENETKYFCNLTNNVVFHLIAGINTIEQIEDIIEYHNKILVLGYKTFGKGSNFYSEKIEDNLYQWYIRLAQFFGKLDISFDNLSIDQLDLKRYFPEKTWNKFYMGNDGTFTFYIDGVNENYAMSSTASKRHKIEEKSIIQMFNHIKNEN